MYDDVCATGEVTHQTTAFDTSSPRQMPSELFYQFTPSRVGQNEPNTHTHTHDPMWLVTSSQHHLRHAVRMLKFSSVHEIIHSALLLSGSHFEQHLKATPSIGPHLHRPEFMNAAASIDCFPSCLVVGKDDGGREECSGPAVVPVIGFSVRVVD